MMKWAFAIGNPETENIHIQQCRAAECSSVNVRQFISTSKVRRIRVSDSNSLHVLNSMTENDKARETRIGNRAACIIKYSPLMFLTKTKCHSGRALPRQWFRRFLIVLLWS